VLFLAAIQPPFFMSIVGVRDRQQSAEAVVRLIRQGGKAGVFSSDSDERMTAVCQGSSLCISIMLCAT
jgi:hypothetical protein